MMRRPPSQPGRKTSGRTLPDRARGLERLQAAIHSATERGEAVPCLGPYRDAWISDDPDEQGAAAELCLYCPVFDACHNYVTEFPEWTVLAGTTARDRQEPNAKQVSAA